MVGPSAKGSEKGTPNSITSGANLGDNKERKEKYPLHLLANLTESILYPLT